MRKIIESDKNGLIKKLNAENNNNFIIHNFNTPEPIPQSIKDLLSIQEEVMSKSEITDRLFKYISENKLCDNKTKIIAPNKKMKKLFKMDNDEVITYYNFQSWLRRIYDTK